MTTNKIKCYYEVLNIERTAKVEEIKISYRKLALQWHPDKNQHQIEIAEERFKEIVNAYTILSDPNERQWYDDHRESILRGGRGGANDDGDYDDDINLWPFFNASCFSNYFDNDDNSFYNVYGRVFTNIDKEEEAFDEDKYHFQPPSFGNSKSSINDVLKFYSYWKDFVSKKKFANADIYHLSEAPNRQIKRIMEKENQKERNKAKQQFNEKVRHLASFIYNHDKRIQEYQKKCAEEAEKKQKEFEIQKQLEEEERKEAIKRHKEEKRLEYEQMKRDGLIDDTESNNIFQDESNSSYCVICEKAFKSEKQLENHQNSNKHKQELARIKKTITLDDELEDNNNNNNNSDNSDEDQDNEINNNNNNNKNKSSSSNKKNKKNKKKSKKVINSNWFNSESDEYVHGLVKNKSNVKKSKSKKKEESEDEFIQQENQSDDQQLSDNDDDDEDEMLVNSLLKNFRINKNQSQQQSKSNQEEVEVKVEEEEEEEEQDTDSEDDVKVKAQIKSIKKKSNKKECEDERSDKDNDQETTDDDDNNNGNDDDDDDDSSNNNNKSNKKTNNNNNNNNNSSSSKPVKKGKAKEKREKRAEKKKQQDQQKEGESLFCNVCKNEYSSRNKLFQHIKDTNHAQAVPTSTTKKRK